MPKKPKVKALVIDPYRWEIYQILIRRGQKNGGSDIYKFLEQFYAVALYYEFEDNESDLLLIGDERQAWDDQKMFSINSKVAEEHWTIFDNPLRGVGVLVGSAGDGEGFSDVRTTLEDLAASITLH